MALIEFFYSLAWADETLPLHFLKFLCLQTRQWMSISPYGAEVAWIWDAAEQQWSCSYAHMLDILC